MSFKLWNKIGLSAGLRLGFLVLSFGGTVLLARLLGPAGIGEFSVAIAYMTLAALVATQGIPSLLSRETARAMAFGKPAIANQLWSWSIRRTVLGLIPATALLAYFQPSHFVILAIATALFSLRQLAAQSLIGHRKQIEALWPDLLLRPFLFTSVVFIWLWSGQSPQVGSALYLFVLGLLLATLVTLYSQKTASPSHITRDKPARDWSAALPYMFGLVAAQFTLEFADLLVVEAVLGTSEAGIFRVAKILGGLVFFAGLSMAAILAPEISRLVALQHIEKLQNLAGSTAVFASIAGVSLFLAYLFFGRAMIGFVFGMEFMPAWPALLVLSFAQILNCVFGLTQTILVMSGLERLSARAYLIGAVVQLTLIWPFTITLGIMGAAIATLIGVVVWNVLMWRDIRSQLGIDASVYSFMRDYLNPRFARAQP